MDKPGYWSLREGEHTPGGWGGLSGRGCREELDLGAGWVHWGSRGLLWMGYVRGRGHSMGEKVALPHLAREGDVPHFGGGTVTSVLSQNYEGACGASAHAQTLSEAGVQ